MPTSTHCHPERSPSKILNWSEGISIPFLASCLLLAASTTRAAEPVTLSIAAASDLQFALQDLAAQFEKQAGNVDGFAVTQIKVRVTYGSSGNFFSQIQNGAPFDLFFSADSDYPRKLEAAGLAEPRTLYHYATGRLVLWVPADSPVDVARRGWDALLDPAIRKIAIANPQHAPYGRAAVAALQHAGLYERVATKLVYGENISQAAQFVQSDNAQAGILAFSLAASPLLREVGKYWEVPANAHPPIAQAAIVLNSSSHKELARAFLAYVKSPAGRALLEKHGFSDPAKPAAPAKTP